MPFGYSLSSHHTGNTSCQWGVLQDPRGSMALRVHQLWLLLLTLSSPNVIVLFVAMSVGCFKKKQYEAL